jgi:hypothetical protein
MHAHPDRPAGKAPKRDKTVAEAVGELRLTPFKTKSKYIPLGIKPPDKNAVQYEPFNLKLNKPYMLHAVYQPNTYLIDLMFINREIVYLVCVNGNTRRLYAEPTNITIPAGDGNITIKQDDTKSANAYITALSIIIDEIRRNRDRQNTTIYLRGDGEMGFISNRAQRYYQTHSIEFQAVRRDFATQFPSFMPYQQGKVKSSPNHTSLSIIDRVIRSIRDMAFNSGVGTITPNIMKELVKLYNNAPHQTLSKIMGFPVSPNQADLDHRLEAEIVKRIVAKNSGIKQLSGFHLRVGQTVAVYNEADGMLKRRSKVKPGTYTVEQFGGILYRLRGPDGKISLQPRYKLKQISG